MIRTEFEVEACLNLLKPVTCNGEGAIAEQIPFRVM